MVWASSAALKKRAGPIGDSSKTQSRTNHENISAGNAKTRLDRGQLLNPSRSKSARTPTPKKEEMSEADGGKGTTCNDEKPAIQKQPREVTVCGKEEQYRISSSTNVTLEIKKDCKPCNRNGKKKEKVPRFVPAHPGAPHLRLVYATGRGRDRSTGKNPVRLGREPCNKAPRTLRKR